MEPKPAPPDSLIDQAKQVMDVVPPPSEQPGDATQPVPAQAGPSLQELEDQSKAAQAKKKPADKPKPKTPHKQGSGVGLAIVATVIIVLGLGLLATFAYLKQN